LLPLDITTLLAFYRETETIAFVGASNDELKQANKIPKYMRSQHFRVIPVNPTADEVLGEPAFRSLSEITELVDVVDVFRPAEEAPAIAADAVAIGASVLWLQLGIVSEEASEIATAGGLTVVMDACIGAVHRKLVRRHGLTT